METVFRLGIIGAGNRVATVLRGASGLTDMTVAALCDPHTPSVDNAMKALAYAPDVCASSAELLRRGDIDGVLVAAPNDLHAPLAREVLAAGKPLYLEKPMGVSVSDCEKIMDAARAPDAKMMVGMQLRYSDVYRQMKKLCDEGAVGEIKMLVFRALRGPFRPGVEGWRMQKRRSGGTILEVSVHQLDLFNWFSAAPLARVAAFGGKDAIYAQEELLDRVTLMAEYENGVQACLQAAVFTPQGADGVGLCVVGTKGSMYQTASEIVVKPSAGAMQTYPTCGYDGMDAEALRGFMAYVRCGTPPLTNPQAGHDAVLLALLAERAIAEQRVVAAGEA